jgi:site-specific recombinase XerD
MICVSGKGRRQAVVPLTQQVGDALATYIKDHRPRPTPMQCLSGHSLRIEPSVTPLPSVSAIVARAMRRVGINCSGETRSSSYPPSLCGQQYVAAGSILQDIAGMLRHGSLLNTEIYAKVDVLTLRQIAQPWPEVKACSLRRCKRIWLCAELWDSG